MSLSDEHHDDNTNSNDVISSLFQSSPSIIILHGYNQVNAIRDAMLHAKCVATNCMITGGIATDTARLPQHVIRKAAHGTILEISPLNNMLSGESFQDVWVNVDDNLNHCKNRYGWGSGWLFMRELLNKCDVYIYVTCESCNVVRQ